MTKIAILDSKKQKAFDAPPRLKKEDRVRYFTLTNELRHSLFNGLRLPINQLGFILQLGYFRASGQFYAAEQFHKRDINHVARTLKLTTVDMAQYNESTRKHHRNLILVHSGWRLPSTEDNHNINNQAKWYVEQQLSPIKVLQTLVEFCWDHHIVIPSYNKFSDIISRHYNEYEDNLLLTLQRTLTLEDKARLDSWFYAPDAKAYNRPPITELRSINQSVSPGDIQKNVATFNSIKSAYEGFNGVMDTLALTDQANEYFATWVQKAQTFQLTSFADRHKSYLHILAYLKHQYYLRQDTLIDIFLKSTLSARSQLQRLLQKRESEQRHHRNSAIKTVSKSNKDLTVFSNQVISIVTMAPTTEIEKVRALENLVEEHLKSFDEKKRQRIEKMEALLESLSDQGYFYDLIESQSIKLQRRVSNIVKTVEFSQRSTDRALLKAILHFKQTQGDIGQSPPLEFLTENEIEKVCTEENPLRVSLYKSLFFFHITDAIKSGGLIFDSTYRFKGIFDYMVDDITWAEQRDNLLATAGLEDFNDVITVLNKLKKQLNGKYRDINQRVLQGDNRFLSFDKSTDKAKVTTPKIDNDDFAFISDTLMQAGYMPIQTILSDINTVCHFSACFTHFMNKHNKMKPSLEMLMAAVMGIGCNIGVTRIANISIGLNEDTLENTVNWFFSLPNIQSASDRIIEYIDKLSLANAYQFDPEATHTASDGQKYYVCVFS